MTEGANQTLLQIFVTQALEALAVLSDPHGPRSKRERAVADLQGAGALLGDEAIEAELRLLCPELLEEDVDAVDRLAELVATVRQCMDAEHDLNDRNWLEDSSPTLIRRKPRRRSSKFDTNEHKTLLSFFRDEALQALDLITSTLLEAPNHGLDEAELNELMRLTHGLKGSAGTVDLPTVAELTHRIEGALDQVRRGVLMWTPRLRDQFVEISDRLRALVLDADDARAMDLAAKPIRALLRNLSRKPEPSDSDSPTTEEPELSGTATMPLDPDDRRQGERRTTDSPMLRVEPERIDRLMDSVGELIFDRNRIERRIGEVTSSVTSLTSALQELRERRAGWQGRDRPLRTDELSGALAELEQTLDRALPDLTTALEELAGDTEALRHTESALQDGLTRIRMQSVRALFQRLGPQLRSIARRAHRSVRLVTAGGDTEFDKSVADQLVDPLIQLLRNAIAHGIEEPEERQRAGKSTQGKIMVSARHEGNTVILEVSDDGAGIDIDKLRTRLRESGLWSERKASLADESQVQQAIFEAGISSRADADELAGRGVGLSAVRETVTRLGGEVLVSSVAGVGTTFTLRLPLTTALASAMLFKVGGHVFAVPNAHVLGQTETHVPAPTHITTEASGEMPLLSLHDLLDFAVPSRAQSLPVICIDYLGKRLAFTCDKVVGAREIVVKRLSPLLSGMALYAGGTISPSGKVQLILDSAALVTVAYKSLDDSARLGRAHADGIARRILVVDDSRAIREAMRHMLTHAGFAVHTAASGEDAWTALSSHRFDVVITDLEMPGGDGFSLLERIRASNRHAGLLAIVISSKTSTVNRERANALGVHRFLPKPVTQDQLVEALRRTAPGASPS